MDNNYESKSQKRNFIFYLSSRFLLTFGSEVFTFTVSFFIMYQTGSAVYTSINLAIFSIVSLLFLPLAGVISDSRNKRSIIILGEILDPIILLGLFLYVYIFDVNIGVLYISTALLTVTSSFVGNAFQSSITNLFRKENVQKVYGYTSTLTESASLLGPIIAGALIGLLSFEYIVIIFIILNVVAVSLDFLLDFGRGTSVENNSGDKKALSEFIDDVTEGVKYILSSRVLKMIVIYLFFVNFVTTTLSILPSKMLIDVLNLPPTYVGIGYAALSLGGILGGLAIGSMKNIQSPLRLAKRFSFVLGGLIVFLPLPIYLTLSDLQNVFIVSTMFILLMISVQFVNIPILNFYQIIIPDYIKGRVFSLITMASMMIMPIGFLFFGFFYDLEVYFMINLFSGVLIASATKTLLKDKVIREANMDYQSEIEKADGEDGAIFIE